MSGLPGPSGPPTSFFPIVPDSEEIMSPYVSTPLMEEINGTLIEMEPPLISDSQRREEISRIMTDRFNAGTDPQKPKDSHIEYLCELEKKLEYELRKDGFTENSINKGRFSWRYRALTSGNTGRYIREYSIKKILIKNQIRDNGPYRRILADVKTGGGFTW